MNIAGECVHRVIDWAEVAVLRVLVFALDEVEGPVFGALFNGSGAQVGVPDIDDEPEKDAEYEGLRVVVVAGADGVAVGGEVDGRVGLGVKLFSELERNVIWWVGESF